MRPSLRPSTYAGYTLDVRRVCERIGGQRLQSLTPAMLNVLYGERGERLAPRTVRGVHTVLRSRSFDHHVRDAGLPKIRLHDLRHTHATLALEAGVPERSEIVGYILGRVGRMDLPVLRQRRLSVGVV